MFKHNHLREADTTLQEAIESADVRPGNQHLYLQGARNVLAILRREQGRFAKAVTLYREQSEIWQRIATPMVW